MNSETVRQAITEMLENDHLQTNPLRGVQDEVYVFTDGTTRVGAITALEYLNILADRAHMGGELSVNMTDAVITDV